MDIKSLTKPFIPNPLDVVQGAIDKIMGKKPVSPVPQVDTLTDGGNLEYAEYASSLTDSFNEAVSRFSKGSPKKVMGAKTKAKAIPTPIEAAIQRYSPQPTPTIIPGFEGRNPEVQKKLYEAFKNVNGRDAGNEAINVAIRESTLNPATIQQELNDVVTFPNGETRRSKDMGVLQINDYWQRDNLAKQGLTPEDMLDVDKNIEFAKSRFVANGNKWGNTWRGNDKLGYK